MRATSVSSPSPLLSADRRFISALPLLHAETAFYHLLMESVTTHTGRLGQLHEDGRGAVIRVLLGVLQGQRPSSTEVMRFALSSLRAIATYHCQHAGEGEKGSAVFGPYIPQLLQSLLHVLLYQHLSAAIVDALADALLPCIIAASSTYVQLAHSVLQRYREERGKGEGGESGGEFSRLESGFLELCTADGLQQTLTMQNRQQFRKSVKRFIETVRVIVQLK